MVRLGPTLAPKRLLSAVPNLTSHQPQSSQPGHYIRADCYRCIRSDKAERRNGETEDDNAGGTKTLWSTPQSAFDTAIAFADLQAGDVSEHAPCFACITFDYQMHISLSSFYAVLGVLNSVRCGLWR
jgi:hypothetical protein